MRRERLHLSFFGAGEVACAELANQDLSFRWVYVRQSVRQKWREFDFASFNAVYSMQLVYFFMLFVLWFIPSLRHADCSEKGNRKDRQVQCKREAEYTLRDDTQRKCYLGKAISMHFMKLNGLPCEAQNHLYFFLSRMPCWMTRLFGPFENNV